MQVLGGHGYIHEWGVEQFVRDARITQIYEGTNGIQALDLVGRKLGQDSGRLLRRFFHPVSDAGSRRTPRTRRSRTSPARPPKAFGRLQQATMPIAQRGLARPEEAAAAATDYLRLFGLTAMAFMWCRMAEVAQAKLKAGANGEVAFYEAKLDVGRVLHAPRPAASHRAFPEHHGGRRDADELAAEAF